MLATWVSGFNPTNPPSGNPWADYYSNVDIKWGNEGTYVRRIQADINTLRTKFSDFNVPGRYYYFPELSVDGDFKDATLNAVKKIQDYFGLGVDGIVGPKTKNILWQYRD